MVNIKQGEKFPVTLTANHNLTGSTTRLIVRHLSRTGEHDELDHDVIDASNGVVEFELDGTWAVGRHYLELDIAQGGEIRTAPRTGQCIIRIDADLDEH